MQQANTHYALPSRLLVTGTDTGVGKTAVAAALANLAARAEKSWAYFKPAESGEPSDSDAGFVAEQTGEPKRVHVAYRLRLPLAPRFAAEAAGKQIEPSKLDGEMAGLATHDPVIVEGAGGILVPYAPNYTMVDFAKAHDLTALVVVGNKLGCLNHALLTLATLRQAGIAVAGCVFNDVGDDMSAARNVADFRLLSDVPVLAWLPRLEAHAKPDASWWDAGVARASA